MVFAVCRRVLHHSHDAEDAFQATFLVLAHKAATVAPRGKLAGWLHGVAHKTALKARHRAARRLEVEKRAPTRTPEQMHPDTNWDEVEPLLDQELTGLPDHYRLPIVMCDLEDRLRTEVAGVLGCSEGTLSSRLTRGRRLLADRLTRRGVYLSGAAVTALFTGRSVALAEPLIRATVPVALSVGATGAKGAVSPSVADLATGVMKSMFLKKLRTAALAAFVVTAAALAVTGVAYQGQAAPVPKNAPVPAADEKKAGDALADAEGRLLMNRKVLKDMKCDIDQLDKIMDALEEAEQKAAQKTNEAMGQLRFNAAGGPPNAEAINKMIQDAQEAGEKEFRKAAAVATDMLTPAQRKRFREIDLQARGHEAFTTPAIIKALDISAKQKEQFEANTKQVAENITQSLQRPVPVPVAPVPVGGSRGGFGAVTVAAFNPGEHEKAMRSSSRRGAEAGAGGPDRRPEGGMEEADRRTVHPPAPAPAHLHDRGSDRRLRRRIRWRGPGHASASRPSGRTRAAGCTRAGRPGWRSQNAPGEAAAARSLKVNARSIR